MTAPFQLFGNFTKVADEPDGSLLIEFTATTERVDDQNEIVDYDAVKKATADYMEWAALREMHQPSAVGTTLSIATDDALRKVTGTAHVVDPLAITKVRQGVYKGVSMGGRKLATQMEKVGGKNVLRITDLVWTELSLVDRPSNADAGLVLAKLADDELAKEDSGFAGGPSEQDVSDQPLKDKPGDVNVSDDAKKAAAQPEDLQKAELTKSAGDDLISAHVAMESIACLIERESTEPQLAPDQVAALKEAYAALQRFEGLESTELGTPEDNAEVTEEQAEIEEAMQAPEISMAYAAVTADLAKRAAGLEKAGARNSAADQQTIDQIHDLAVAAGAYPDDHTAADDTATEEPEAEKAAGLSAQSIAKAISAEFAQGAPFAKAADVQAIEERLLGLLEPMKEQLSKIAATPMPGGPVRFAAPGWQGPAGVDVQRRVSDELSKAAESISDPRAREALQRQAAALDIRSAWAEQK
jgi:hypothetical protein